jgi:hypothetical protein
MANQDKTNSAISLANYWAGIKLFGCEKKRKEKRGHPVFSIVSYFLIFILVRRRRSSNL